MARNVPVVAGFPASLLVLHINQRLFEADVIQWEHAGRPLRGSAIETVAGPERRTQLCIRQLDLKETPKLQTGLMK